MCCGSTWRSESLDCQPSLSILFNSESNYCLLLHMPSQLSHKLLEMHVSVCVACVHASECVCHLYYVQFSVSRLYMISGLTILTQITNWCVLPWERLFLPVSAVLNCISFLVYLRFISSISASLLVLYLLKSCWGSHFVEVTWVMPTCLVSQETRSLRFLSSLAPKTFLPSLLRWSHSLMCKRSTVDISAGAGIYTLAPHDYFVTCILTWCSFLKSSHPLQRESALMSGESYTYLWLIRLSFKMQLEIMIVC